MKKYILLLVIAFSGIMVMAQDNDKIPFHVKSLTNESIKNIQVQTSGGNISVFGVNQNEAKIEVYVQANNDRNAVSKEEIQKRLEDYTLDVSVSNNKVTAIAKQKLRNMDWRKGLSISFKIYVPQNVSTMLTTSGGSISLKDISGTQNFSTSGGSLHVDNLSGSIKGRTSGGSIHFANSKNDIDLSTSGGSISADNCSGNIMLSTSGGSLKLNDLNGIIKTSTSGGSINGKNISGELIAHTSGGSIILNDLSCSLETSTSGGHIDVAIKELGKYIKISNSGGNIQLEIPKNKGLDLNLTAHKVKTDELNNFNGKIEDDSIRGSVNGGGIPVNVSASSGRINVSLK